MKISFLYVFLIWLLSGCGYNISKIPKGTLISSHLSPNEKFTINIYLCDGGATVDSSIRGELVDNESKTQKNIYWNYHEDSAEVIWINDTTVVINEQQLNVLEDVFDFREH